jgi:hypothetical protein
MRAVSEDHYVAGSVVETDIHWPTDATLLRDTVRTVTRLVENLGKILPRGLSGFSNRKRSARRRMQALFLVAKRGGWLDALRYFSAILRSMRATPRS